MAGTLSIEPNPGVTFRIRHEDDDLIVVDKPPGVVSQPGKGHETDSLLNGLFARHGPRLQNLGQARDFGLLHRLDKEASGLLVAALRPRAYDALRAAFESRDVGKFYWAVCARAPRRPAGVIRIPIAESLPRTGERKIGRLVRAPAPARPQRSARGRSRDGPLGVPKEAVTAYRVLATGPDGTGAALVDARPLTGRLHQVRLHLRAVGAPILGDDLYAPASVAHACHRLALHAHRLVLPHPATGERLTVDSPFPRDLRAILQRLRLPRPDAPGPSVTSTEPPPPGRDDALGELLEPGDAPDLIDPDEAEDLD